MSEIESRASTPRLHDRLEAITALLRRREDLLAFAGAAPDGDEAALEATDAELQSRLDELHPADLADVLESLPLEDRLAVWQRVRSDRDGDILLEVSDSVRETLIADMDDREILAAVEPLDADELADLVDDLPTEVLPELMASLDAQERERVQAAMSYEDDQVGALMDFDMRTSASRWCCATCAGSTNCPRRPTSCSSSTRTTCSPACCRCIGCW